MNKTGMIFAAVKGCDDFELAIKSKVSKVFYLYPDIKDLKTIADKAHNADKKIFIHIDLTAGLGKDHSGIEYAKKMGIDGIISTRTNLIKAAKECGLITIQRFFIVDSHSIDTTVETVKASKADFIEVMPGIAHKIIEKLKTRIATPIIAGGIIETIAEVAQATDSGAYAVSTSAVDLWN